MRRKLYLILFLNFDTISNLVGLHSCIFLYDGIDSIEIELKK